jgi:hypothetical protein
VKRWSKIALVLPLALLLGALACVALKPAGARHLVGIFPASGNSPSNLSAAVGSRNRPSVVFWAWERPEDFRFLPPDRASVAFLAKTIYLSTPTSDSSSSFMVRPRLQPLRLAPGTPLIAVVRLETRFGPEQLKIASRETVSSFRAASYSVSQREELASEIAATQSIPGVSAVQIDFDAPASAHTFYALLLQDVRRKLPSSLPLSITALASWCIGDRWLAQLPANTIEEAVPMLFRMGPDAVGVARFLHSGADFPVAACRNSLGLSTDEKFSADILSGRFAGLSSQFRQRKIYVFSGRGQTAAAAESVLQEWHP